MTLLCPPRPELKYQREPCHKCGAVTEVDAETMCKPESDETGERWCGSDFHEGYAVAPTQESLLAECAWYDAHYACDADGCAAQAFGEIREKAR
jgi:hypothetical protein